MNCWPPIARRIAILLAAVLLALPEAAPVFAQAPAPAAAPQDQAARPRGTTPVMENVFYNVIWGSAVGALIGAASAIEGSQDKSNPDNFRGAAFQGATLGGVVGIGVAVWLVYAGITFDPAGSTITGAAQPASPADPVVFQPKDLTPAPGEPPRPAVSFARAGSLPPFALETAPGQPGKITGFRALVLDLHF
jgi:hypothetical protein